MYVRKQLNALEFDCSTCTEQFRYDQRKEHWQTCGLDLDCGIHGCPETSFGSLSKLEEHWLKECDFIDVQCMDCKATTRRGDYSTHDCKRALKDLIER